MRMKKLNKRVILKVCRLVGACLLAVGVVVLLYVQWDVHSSMQKNESYVQTLHALTPDPQGAVPEERKDNSMPVLAVDGADFVGILEMPQYGSTLPVCAEWGRLTKYPCRFDGSIYNRTMKIGATSQRGQCDFYREISVGDTVLFTDMEGNRYTYAVANLRYENHADRAALEGEEAALTVFIKNVYDFEYLIISCDVIN